MAAYLGLTTLGTPYLLAAGCSFVVAVTSNFFGHLLWTFKNRNVNQSVPKQYLLFFIISTITLGINLFGLQFLVEHNKMNQTLAQLISIIAVSGLNFSLNYLVTFGKAASKQQREVPVSYESSCHSNL